MADAVVAGQAVPVDRDEVDGAAAAGRQEPGEPVQPHLAAAVAHRGRSQLRLAGVRLQVLPPRLDGLLRGQVGLLREIRFVERQQMGRAGGDGFVSVRFPAAGVHGQRAPHHGNEIELGGNGASGLRVPVVAPRDDRGGGERLG